MIQHLSALAATVATLVGASTPAVPAPLGTSATAVPAPLTAPVYPARAHVAHATDTLSPVDHRYLKLYHEAQVKLGARAPGRNIVRWGLSDTKRASVTAITTSIGTLERMLAVPVATPTATATVASVSPAVVTAAPAASGLTACIIQRESGGNSQIVNSSGHMGLGQWDETTWLADGGGRFGATPLDASAAEQEQIIEDQVAAGNTGQWTNYDGC